MESEIQIGNGGSPSELPTTKMQWAAVEHLMTNWHRRAREGQMSNYDAADRYLAFNYYLGIPVVIIAAVVGATAFASIGSEMGQSGKILTGLVSMVSAILAGLQTFLGYAERAEKHRSAGTRFGAIRREIEEIAAILPEARGEVKVYLDGLRTRLDEAASQSPEVSRRVWSNAMTKIKDDPGSPLFPKV